MRSTPELVEEWNDLVGKIGVEPPQSSSGMRRFRARPVTQGDVDHAAAQIQLGIERDAIQETRPEGCWCLGLGGRGTAVMPHMAYFEAEEVFEEFCDCPEGQAEHKRVRYVFGYRQGESARFRLQRHWDNCGIPKRFRDLRLETSPLRDTMPDLIARLLPPTTPNVNDDEDPAAWDAWHKADMDWRRSWFFWGSFGTGKTGLAAGYAREYLHDTEEPILFRSLPDLMAELRATYNRPRHKKFDGDEEEEGPTEADLIARLSSVSLLILDDLGAEQVKETGDGSWVADRLFQIIGKRHAEELTTVFTSNLNMSQLKDRIGDRLAWRIVEMCGKDHIIHVEGKNLRA